MTSSVMIFHSGGNKQLAVIVEGLMPGDENSEPSWKEVHRVLLSGGGSFTPSQLYVHDTQRIRIEEIGEFIS